MANIREEFKGYSEYTNEEYKRIWRDGIIVVDTNILLNFYRYTDETRNKMYNVLLENKERLWIPYQVAKEYFKNKTRVIGDTISTFETLKKEVDENIQNLNKTIDSHKSNRLECKEKIIEIIDKVKVDVIDIIDKEEKNRGKNASEKNVEKLIFNLLDNNMGDEIVGEEFEKIKKEGIQRRDNKIPPGYKDAEKDENGDYYIFYAIIKYAKEIQKDVIFVTDDVKPDWFIEIRGEKKGGQYTLLNEFYKKTGKLLLIYNAEGFAKKYSEINDKKANALDENFIRELGSVRDNYNVRNYKRLTTADRISNLINMIQHDDNINHIYRYINRIRETTNNEKINDKMILLKMALERNERDYIEVLLESLKRFRNEDLQKKDSYMGINSSIWRIERIIDRNDLKNEITIRRLNRELELLNECFMRDGIPETDKSLICTRIKNIKFKLDEKSFNEEDLKNDIIVLIVLIKEILKEN